MAIVRWTGNATATAQIHKYTVTDVGIGDIFTLTATGLDQTTHAISFTATLAAGAGVSEVTAALTALWNNSGSGLLTPITATDNDPFITLTADSAGAGFTVTPSDVDGDAADIQDFVEAVLTAGTGPMYWDDADNWDDSNLPGADADDEVYIENWSGDILYGLDQSGVGNKLTSLNIGNSFTGKIGPNGAAGQAAEYLEIDITALNIGQHYGPGNPVGSGRIKINLSTIECTVVVTNSGTSADTGKPAIRFLANKNTTTIHVKKGTAGLAFEAGETSSVATTCLP